MTSPDTTDYFALVSSSQLERALWIEVRRLGLGLYRALFATTTSIEQLTLSDARSCFAQYYRPDRTRLVLVGFVPEAAKGLISPGSMARLRASDNALRCQHGCGDDGENALGWSGAVGDGLRRGGRLGPRHSRFVRRGRGNTRAWRAPRASGAARRR